jgi:uncharacterized protein (UPF0548 family)
MKSLTTEDYWNRQYPLMCQVTQDVHAACPPLEVSTQAVEQFATSLSEGLEKFPIHFRSVGVGTGSQCWNTAFESLQHLHHHVLLMVLKSNEDVVTT